MRTWAACSTTWTSAGWRRIRSSSTHRTTAFSWASTAGTTSASCTSRRLRVPLMVRYPRLEARGRVDDAHGAEHRFRAHDSGFRGRRSACDHAGPEPAAAARRESAADWRQSVYYAYFENSWALRGKGREALSDPSLRVFTAHRVSPHRGVRTDAAQADRILLRRRLLGAVRPGEGSARAAQCLRRRAMRGSREI